MSPDFFLKRIAFLYDSTTVRSVDEGDVRVIQPLLGHAKLETTKIYSEVSIKILQSVH